MVNFDPNMRSPLPHVTIIVVHYKDEKVLLSCVKSLLKSEYANFSVVVVDNGSTDRATDKIRDLNSSKIMIMKANTNLGFIGGNNLAIRSVSGEYLVLLNDDTLVDPNWLNFLVETAESDRQIAACHPKLLSLKRPGYFEYNGACGGMLDYFGVPLTRGRLFELAEKDYGQYNSNVEVFWATGAAMFIRRSALVEAGLLDDLLYAHMEEIDLSWRLRLRGYKIVAVPESVVFHIGGNTPLSSKLFLKQRNNLVIMIKNYSYGSLVRFLTLRIVLDALTLCFSLAKADTHRVNSIIKAYVWILLRFRPIFISRLKSQASRLVSDTHILKSMIKYPVAVQFYLLGRKRFRELSGLPQPSTEYVVAEGSKEIHVADMLLEVAS